MLNIMVLNLLYYSRPYYVSKAMFNASRFNNETGEWKHFDNLEYRERKWLGNISYASGKFEFREVVTNIFVLLNRQPTPSRHFVEPTLVHLLLV